MGSFDPELGCGVVEGTHFLPSLGSVAGLTGHLGLVRIEVTRVAGSGDEAVLARRTGRRAILAGCRRRHRASRHQWFVAVVAGYGGVPPGESELSLRVALG